jgi:PhnB protein
LEETMAKPIPDGAHTIAPHLTIEGAADAIEFYKKAFEAKEMMRMPAADGKRVMHASLKIGDSTLMLNDSFPEWGSPGGPKTLGGTPVTIHLYVEDCDAVFNRAVAAGATVTMPLADMFWGDRYGRITDPFGHNWSIATHKKDLTAAEVLEGGKAAMAEMARQRADKR